MLEGIEKRTGEQVGVGLDSCVLPTRHKGLYIVQTTDFFYPLVEDPYMQGMIGCANVLSDLYAMGVPECDNMLMLLGVSNELTKQQGAVVNPLMIQGFNDQAKLADTSINGGQTVINPWYIIGGVASAVVTRDELIMPDGAMPGDVIVLTKALGTQIAVNAHQWMHLPAWWDKIKDIISVDEVKVAYKAAMFSMARLNRTAARLMRKHAAHAATDVTGFGVIGHAQNLCSHQKEQVDFILESLPIFANMNRVAERAKEKGLDFKLVDGYSAETSGGLLICMSSENASKFCEEILQADECEAWVIGKVVQGNKEAKIIPNVKILEV